MLKEKLYKVKRSIIREYQRRFTIQNPETCILSDRAFIKKIYYLRMGKKINLRNPKTFCEKENWLKLYDRRPEYTMMADKYAVREYISKKIGEEYLVPLLGVWDNSDDINFEKLPSQFVLKCNHNSDVIICTNKQKLNIKEAREKLSIQLEQDYYLRKREWPYKNIPRKIICEKYMENTNGDVLVDYKIFCFNGSPKFIMVNSNRFGDGTINVDMYDMEWKHLDMQDGHYPMAGDFFEKPECFDEMMMLSRKLSKGIPFVRIDFNYWNRKLYFGELTFFHSAGLESFQPEEWDVILGSWLQLPKKRRK